MTYLLTMRRTAAALAILLCLGTVAYFVLRPPEPRVSPPAMVARAKPRPVPSTPTPVSLGTGELSGRVFGADGKPMADVAIDVKPAAALQMPDDCPGLIDGCTCGDRLEPSLQLLERAFQTLGKANSDHDGRFTVKGLPEGPLRVRGSDLLHYATVEARAGDDAVVLSLVEPLTLSVMVNDEDYHAVEGATVIASLGGKVIDFDRTGPGGENFPYAPAAAKVRVFAPGFAPGVPTLGATVGWNFETEDGGEFTVSGRPVTLERGVRVRGKLAWPEGGAMAGATLVASSAGNDGDRPCAVATTADDGSYDLGLLPGSQVQLHAAVDGRHFSSTFPADSQPRLVDGGKPPPVIEQKSVRGQVVDARGVGLPDAVGTLESFGGVTSVALKLDAQGRFEHFVDPGVLTLEVSHPRRLRWRERHTLEPGASWEPTVVLGDAVELSGWVVDATGTAVEGARVSAHAPAVMNNPFQRPAVTDALGAFSMAVLPGDLLVEVEATGYPSKRAEAHTPLRDLKLVLERGVSLTGQVLNPDRTPAASISIQAQGRTQTGTYSDADGKFTLEAVDLGPVVITAREHAKSAAGALGPLKRSATISLDLTQAAPSPIELVLVDVAAGRGRVIDERGNPVAGVQVLAGDSVVAQPSQPVNLEFAMVLGHLQTSAGVMFGKFQATTDAAGAFRLEGLERPVRLSVNVPGLREDPRTPVMVSPGSDVVLRVIRPRFLSGVFSSPDGRPMTQVSVAGIPVPTPSGQLKFEIRVEGTGPVHFAADGFLTEMRSLTLSPLADTALGNVRFRAGRTLIATATDAVTGAALKPDSTWWTLTGSPVSSTLNGPEKVLTVPEGQLTLEASAFDYLPQPLQVAANQTRVSVQLEPGAVISGSVKGLVGRDLSAGLVVSASAGSKEALGFVREDGNFSVTGLAPGVWKVGVKNAVSGVLGPVTTVVVAARSGATVELTWP